MLKNEMMRIPSSLGLPPPHTYTYSRTQHPPLHSQASHRTQNDSMLSAPLPSFTILLRIRIARSKEVGVGE